MLPLYWFLSDEIVPAIAQDIQLSFTFGNNSLKNRTVAASSSCEEVQPDVVSPVLHLKGLPDRATCQLKMPSSNRAKTTGRHKYEREGELPPAVMPFCLRCDYIKRN